MQKYQLLAILNLTNRFIQSLDKVGLNLKEIEDDEELTSQFYNLANKLSEKLIEHDEEQKHEHAKDDEMEVLKDECLSRCFEIQNIILNQSGHSGEYFSTRIEKTTEALRENKINTSIIFFLDFLADSTYLKNSFTEQSVEELFQACCDILKNQVVQQIEEIKFQEEDKVHEISDIQNACQTFISAYIQNILTVLMNEYKISVESDNKAQNQKEIEAKIERLMSIYNKITDNTQEIFKICGDSTERVTEEVQKINQDENGETIVQQYTSYQEHLFNVAVKLNPFLDYIHLFVCCVASGKYHEMTQSLNQFYQNSFGLLKSFEDFYLSDSQIYNTKLSIKTDS